MDDSQIYDYDHPEQDRNRGQNSNRPESRASQHGPENGYGDQGHQNDRRGKEYYPYGPSSQDRDDDDDDEMW